VLENTVKKQAGGFTKGRSGNPSGRPKGALNNTTKAAMELLDGEAEAITRKAIELALAGELPALKLVLERIIPVKKEALVHLVNNASDLVLTESQENMLKRSLTNIEEAAVARYKASLIEVTNGNNCVV